MSTKTQQTTKLVKKNTPSEVDSPATQKPLKNSFYEKSKHLVGSVDSGLGDLSSNKEYLKGFGRSTNADNR
jgi:hypothetical protein